MYNISVNHKTKEVIDMITKTEFIEQRSKYLRNLIGVLQLSDIANEITYNYAVNELAKLYDMGV